MANATEPSSGNLHASKSGAVSLQLRKPAPRPPAAAPAPAVLIPSALGSRILRAWECCPMYGSYKLSAMKAQLAAPQPIDADTDIRIPGDVPLGSGDWGSNWGLGI